MSQQTYSLQHPNARISAGRPELDSWDDDGGAGDARAKFSEHPHGDLNDLLAQEQTAIMNEEAATTVGGRDGHREEARRLRGLVELTGFRARKPYDFKRRQSPQRDVFARDFEALKQHVEDMESLLAKQFSEGTVGFKHNTFQHRSRLICQARARLSKVALCGAKAATADR